MSFGDLFELFKNVGQTLLDYHESFKLGIAAMSSATQIELLNEIR